MQKNSIAKGFNMQKNSIAKGFYMQNDSIRFCPFTHLHILANICTCICSPLIEKMPLANLSISVMIVWTLENILTTIFHILVVWMLHICGFKTFYKFNIHQPTKTSKSSQKIVPKKEPKKISSPSTPSRGPVSVSWARRPPSRKNWASCFSRLTSWTLPSLSSWLPSSSLGTTLRISVDDILFC